MTSERLKSVRPFLEFLLSDSITFDQARVLFSKLSNSHIQAINEIVHNLLNGNLQLKADFQKYVKKYRIFFKKILKVRSLKKKKDIIKKHWQRVWTIIINLEKIFKKVWK
jgi:hypothetical protein